jgi:hypothetical protein
MNKITVILLAALIYFSTLASASGVIITIFINSSEPGYPAGVGLDEWAVLASSTTITSIDPSKIVSINVTNATGYGTIDVPAGTYYITAINYNDTDVFASTPMVMGTIMDNPTTLRLLNTSVETSGSINDYTNASAIRGYVKSTSGVGLNGGRVYINGTYRGVPITSLPVTTRTFRGDAGYYSIFLPVENASSTYTVRATKTDYKDKNKTVITTKGFGSASSQLVNFSLTSTKIETGGGGGSYNPEQPTRQNVLIVANSIDMDLATDFQDNLKNSNFNPTFVSASEFTPSMQSDNRLIIVLGGPDAPEGIGEIVQGLLTDTEMNTIRQDGSQTMYTKTNPYTDRFTSQQKVIVLAGSDRTNTQIAERIYFDDVKDTLHA